MIYLLLIKSAEIYILFNNGIINKIRIIWVSYE